MDKKQQIKKITDLITEWNVDYYGKKHPEPNVGTLLVNNGYGHIPTAIEEFAGRLLDIARGQGDVVYVIDIKRLMKECEK